MIGWRWETIDRVTRCASSAHFRFETARLESIACDGADCEVHDPLTMSPSSDLTCQLTV
jgi:hypothetical protein